MVVFKSPDKTHQFCATSIETWSGNSMRVNRDCATTGVAKQHTNRRKSAGFMYFGLTYQAERARPASAASGSKVLFKPHVSQVQRRRTTFAACRCRSVEYLCLSALLNRGEKCTVDRSALTPNSSYGLSTIPFCVPSRLCTYACAMVAAAMPIDGSKPLAA